MPLNPTPALLEDLYWITLLAVVVSSASGVLKAGFRQFDLFGVIIIAVATGLGGGSLRDMLLDRPVFWIHDQSFFVASVGSAIAIFVLARFVKISDRLFLIPDAAGLATFGVAGTMASMMVEAPWLIASFMGVATGTVGGMIRDVLCNETPIVFESPLYATVSWAGSLLFISLIFLEIEIMPAMLIAGLSIFIARLAALHYRLKLPKYQTKS